MDFSFYRCGFSCVLRPGFPLRVKIEGLLFCRYGGIGRRAGFRFQWYHRVGSSPTICTTSLRTAYRSQRLFYAPHQKSLLIHSVAAPLQTESAPLGFGLGSFDGSLFPSASTPFVSLTSDRIPNKKEMPRRPSWHCFYSRSPNSAPYRYIRAHSSFVIVRRELMMISTSASSLFSPSLRRSRS